MAPERCRSPRRPLLLSCIALALAGTASAAPIPLYTHGLHLSGWLDSAAGSKPLADPVSTSFNPSHVQSVFNCADSGTGSLRAAVAAAADGDTIDLTHLACSTITLTTGSINIPQNTLSLVGPGPSLLSLYLKVGPDRILTHAGTGTLTIAGLTIESGFSNYDGGCIRSAGNLTLSNAMVDNCLSGGFVQSPYDHDNRGGAVFVAGNLTMSSSTVDGNTSRSLSNGRAYGGGVFVRGSAYIRDSTISNNASGEGTFPGNVGGIAIAGRAPSVIVNSTISGNTANNTVGGLYVYTQLTLSGSTIAFNKSTNGQTVAAGMYAYNGPLVMNSTIIANNTWGSGNYEFDLTAFQVSGANNLVMGSNDSPPATLTADPHLQPLANNGGPTKTHAILATSAAVDAGNNVAGSTTDQRGSGFSRIYGPHADIGAFELQPPPPDIIFRNGFE